MGTVSSALVLDTPSPTRTCSNLLTWTLPFRENRLPHPGPAAKRAVGLLNSFCSILFQLGSLPESFSNLRKLETLDLFSNRLTELPDVINHLGNLKRLDLDENQFKLELEDVPRIHRKLTYPDKPKVTSGGKDWRTRGRQDMIHDVKKEKVNFTRKSRRSDCQKKYWTKSDIASRRVHRESNLMFTLSSVKDQKKICFRVRSRSM